jgi:ATP-GRASP peptide maturase of grasp-with-spasm system
MKKKIIQSEIDDTSTNEVIDWLLYLNKCLIIRLNDKCILQEISISINNINQSRIEFKQINNETLSLDAFDNFWYRRGFFSLNNNIPRLMHKNSFIDLINLKNKRNNFIENNYIINEIYNSFSYNNNRINTFSNVNINKVEVLIKAVKYGINVPQTLVSNSVIKIIEFHNKFNKVYVKNLEFVPFSIEYYNDVHFNVGFNLAFLDSQNILNLQSVKKLSSPLFFQMYIEKKYEIRVFYLKGVFKSMAIFSQQDEATKYDFRNYNNERPNRYIPYKLPAKLENKLHKLMKELKLESGSIDLLFSVSNEYVFLEVNPIGQFQWLSKNCNYYIEKDIALLLIN